MNIAPVGSWIVSHAALTPPRGIIARPDSARGVSRCYVIEAAGPDAVRAGFEPGDIVMARAVHDLFLEGGEYHRALFVAGEIIGKMHGIVIAELIGLDGRRLQPIPGLDERPDAVQE